MRDSGADPRLCGTQSDRAAQGSDLRSSALRPLPGQEREAECETPSRAQPLRAADHHDPLQQGPFLRALGRGQEQGASARVGSLGPGGYPAPWLRGAETSSGGSGRASPSCPGRPPGFVPAPRAGREAGGVRAAGILPRGPGAPGAGLGCRTLPSGQGALLLGRPFALKWGRSAQPRTREQPQSSAPGRRRHRAFSLFTLGPSAAGSKVRRVCGQPGLPLFSERNTAECPFPRPQAPGEERDPPGTLQFSESRCRFFGKPRQSPSVPLWGAFCGDLRFFFSMKTEKFVYRRRL